MKSGNTCLNIARISAIAQTNFYPALLQSSRRTAKTHTIRCIQQIKKSRQAREQDKDIIMETMELSVHQVRPRPETHRAMLRHPILYSRAWESGHAKEHDC